MEISNEQLDVLARSIAAKVGHNQPSPKTLSMLDDINKKLDNIEKSSIDHHHALEMHVQDFRHFKETITERLSQHIEEKESALKELDCKIKDKADMWVQKAVTRLTWAVVFTVAPAVVISLLYFVHQFFTR